MKVQLQVRRVARRETAVFSVLKVSARIIAGARMREICR